MRDSITIRRHPLTRTVLEALRGRCGVMGGERLVVAVSGGADSVALLRVLAGVAAQREWELDLHVAHVQHHLRDEAEEDEAFVEVLTGKLGLPFERRDVDVPAAGGNVEAAARRLRYAALCEVAATVGADAIVTAHHADDQLETMLMRLVRGASVKGLAGIAPRRKMDGHLVLRPMLGVIRERITRFLGDIGQPYRTDHTNADVSRWRARLRADVLPVLRELRADAALKADECAGQLRAAGGVIEKLAARHDGDPAIARDTARRMNRTVLTALIRRHCQRLGAAGDQLGGRVVGPIVTAARDTSGQRRQFTVAGGVTVVVDREQVRWTA